MKIETLKKSYLKRNIIIGIIVVLIMSGVILTFTRAKYRVTQSIPIVNGTINYTLPDLNIVGLYIDGEEATELNSDIKYTLDTEQSICTYKDGTEIPNLSISYDTSTGGLSISPYTTKGTKCTLYFEEYKVPAKDIILANKTISTRTDFSTIVTEDTTGTIYQATDDDGTTYYFAGAPTDNWVRWAGFYWRIIRINGDGTIRLIYQGTSGNTTGTGTQIQTSAFNSIYSNNMYVGYMYQSNQVHGLTSSSTIKEILDTWYQNNLASYADDLDGNAGFCGDRTPYTNTSGTTSGGGTGTTETYYGAYIRLITNKAPTFECENDGDLYTTSGSEDGNKALQYPIGLISADEVAFAGGRYGTSTPNQSYYLYTGQYYWTMSPSYADRFGYALVFRVDSDGTLNGYSSANRAYGVRPVINLRADVQLSGSGTATDPYTIVET